jgi:DNA adenine methylase
MPSAKARLSAKDGTRPTVASPFLKWVGGKRQLLPSITTRAPSQIAGTYWEPFLGGGALFFALAEQGRVQRAVLCDANLDLIDTYRCVREKPESLIRALRRHRNDEEHFYGVRATKPSTLSPVRRAARFIFLNRCGYNGLYRVNSRGDFNVPFGRYANPTICDAENIRAASRTLQIAELRHVDFEDADSARRDDFVYFDPPYVPLSKTASFTAYVRTGFTSDDQRRLRALALRLKNRGVRILLSNSSSDEVRDLYSQGFTVETVDARRLINCQPSGRKAVPELLIH